MGNSAETRPGRVVFVGAGPGAPDLLTVRAAERLRQADVVVHDALVPPAILDLVPPGAECIPSPRDREPGRDPGEAIGRLLAGLARAGRCVVRLKGGDPGVFARLSEEIGPLREAGIPHEIVPGVTAALAAAAAAGVPLTSRGAASSLTLVTGREADDKPEDSGELDALAALPGTVAVYMGIEQAARWSAAMLAAGRPGDTPVTIVSRCSWPEQRVGRTTLARCAAELAATGWRSPAVVIVGSAGKPADPVGPLAGRRVLVTRPAGQADDLTLPIRAAGGECLHVPLVEIVAPASWSPLDAVIDRLDTYDWVVFASANGVHGFMTRLRHAGRDLRALGTARVAAIGPATRRALEVAGLAVDLVPTDFRSEGLVAALSDQPPGGRYLLIRAEQGRDLLRTTLESAGHRVDAVAAYASRTLTSLTPELLEMIDATPVDWITLTSPLIAETAVRLFGDRLRRWQIATISPVTSAALAAAGLAPTVEAARATSEGIVAAIVGRCGGPRDEAAEPAESPPPARLAAPAP